MKKDESAAPVSGSTRLVFALCEPGYRPREAHQSQAMTLSDRGASFSCQRREHWKWNGEGSLFYNSELVCGLLAWGNLIPAFKQGLLTQAVLRQKTLPAASGLRKAKPHSSPLLEEVTDSNSLPNSCCFGQLLVLRCVADWESLAPKHSLSREQKDVYPVVLNAGQPASFCSLPVLLGCCALPLGLEWRQKSWGD